MHYYYLRVLATYLDYCLCIRVEVSSCYSMRSDLILDYICPDHCCNQVPGTSSYPYSFDYCTFWQL